MLKTLLIISAIILLTACGKSLLAKKSDKSLRFKVHSSIAPQQPNWARAEIKKVCVFGQYPYNPDSFHRYRGDPQGSIVAAWEITHYLGNKPDFRDCVKPDSPSEVAKRYGFDSPVFKKAEREYDKLYAQYNKCYFEDNRMLEEKSKTLTYFYARSPQSHKLVIPEPEKRHAMYEANLNLGPLGGVPLDKLPENLKAIKDQLIPSFCYGLYSSTEGKEWRDCYRLPGNESSIYYQIRSLLKSTDPSKGMPTPDYIHNSPENWQEIKGITLTKEQFLYMKKRCEKTARCFLDENAPDLTNEQKAYIKATTWDTDKQNTE